MYTTKRRREKAHILLQQICTLYIGLTVTLIPYDCFTKLYDALVLSIITYGSAIWGFKEYNCINVHNRACRYFLGVGKYTPNAAVHGDMNSQYKDNGLRCVGSGVGLLIWMRVELIRLYFCGVLIS